MTALAALKAPAQDYTLPAWVTMHNAELAGAALVIILLTFAVLRLSKGHKAPIPAPAPKKSGGGGGKFLLLAGLGGAGYWYWDTHMRHAPAGAVKAAPAPSPSPVPTPRPTVTQTVAPHVTLPAHFPLTGTQILIGLAVIAVIGYLTTRVVVRNQP
jgi:hypothetical protein